MDCFEMNLSGANEYPYQKPLRALVAGGPGSGKTHLGTLFPNPIFANSGPNLTTLGRIGNVPYVNVTSEKDLYSLKLALDRPAEEREQLFGRPIETLVIDTLDELQRLLMIGRVAREGRTETKIDDWGWIGNRLHSIFSGLIQLDVNILILTGIKEVTFVGGEAILKPAIGGSFCDGVHGYVDHSLLVQSRESIDNVDLDDVIINEITGERELKSVYKTSIQRQLICAPQVEAPWINDKTSTLPVSLSVTPDIYSTIYDLVNDVDLTNSMVVGHCVEQEPLAEESEVTETTNESASEMTQTTQDFLNQRTIN